MLRLQIELTPQIGFEDTLITLGETYPDMKKYVDEVLLPNYDLRAQNLVQAIQLLEQPNTFMWYQKNRLFFAYNQMDPKPQFELRTLGKERHLSEGFLLEKQSPLLDMFKVGLMTLRESGLLDKYIAEVEYEQLIRKMVKNQTSCFITNQAYGLGIGTLSTSQNGEAITAGQSTLVFIMMMGFFILCTLIFLLELFWNKRMITSRRQPVVFTVY